ncbi:MAG: helix-turn-helix domain-containing protein [Alphaproteobacteria bacterium]
MEVGLPIGALSARTGCSVQAIRYYEQIGLLPPPDRTEGGQRRYGAAATQRLAFIRHARDLGFEVAQIRELLDLGDQPDRPCAEADAIARAHLAAVEDKIRRLQALRAALGRMVEACGHGQIADCRVMETLADHGLCAGSHR